MIWGYLSERFAQLDPFEIGLLAIIVLMILILLLMLRQVIGLRRQVQSCEARVTELEIAEERRKMSHALKEEYRRNAGLRLTADAS